MSRVALPLLVILALPAPGRAAPEQPRLVLETGGHTGRVKGVFFTPGGKELVTVGEDKTIRVWNLAGGEATRVLRLPLGPYDRPGAELGLSADMTPDGQWLAVVGPAPAAQEFWAYLIDLPAGKVTRVIKIGKERLWAVALSADGKRLACGGTSQVVPVYDTTTGERKASLPGTGRLRRLAFSPNGKQLAGGGLDKAVHVWDVETGGPARAFTGHTGPVGGLAWGPDGRVLASRSATDRNLIIWNPADGKQSSSARGQHGGVGIAFPAVPGKVLAGGTLFDLPAGSGRLRPMASLRADLSREESEAPAGDEAESNPFGDAVDLSPDGRVAAFGSRDGVYIWFPVAPAGKAARPDPIRLGGKGHPVLSVGWSAAGDAVAWGRAPDKPDQGAFHLSELRSLDPADATWTGASHAGGGLTLKASGGKGSGSQLAILKGPDTVRKIDLVEAINAYSFVGDRFAAIGTPFGLRLFDTGTGKLARSYGDVAAVRTVAGQPGGDLFASSGLDQVVRVWSPDHTHPLLSVYAAGGEWVAWAPAGYYAASPGGDRLVGWQVNSGYEQFATFHPAAQFRKSLYRPDVISRVVATRDVRKAVEEADKARKAPSAPMSVADVLPPRVAVVSPAPGTTVSGPTLKVKAVAEGTADRPVTALRLLVDGRPYTGTGGLFEARPVARGTVQHEWVVDLPAGKHQVSVLAQSEVSRAESEAVQVTRPATTPADPGKPGLYVLAVGINAYPGDWKLRCAVNDAQGLCRTFEEKSAGLFRVATKVVADAAATRTGIMGSLAWLKERMTPADTAIVFFAGHGQTGAGGRFYLQPVDWDADDLDRTCITGAMLQKYFSELPGRVFLVLDCCHSQAAAADKVLTRPKHAATDALVRDLRDEEVAIGVWVSAQSSEFALEKRDLGHGLFTLAMIDGLAGAADYNGDGEVYLTELDLYVTEQVRLRSGRKQTPALSRPLSAPFALSRK